MPSWRELRAETRERLAAAGIEPAAAEARWLTERASGYGASEWAAVERADALARNVAHLDAMVARRLAGEPLQYVLGEWSFRGHDLLVDGRVLIPRPETEWVVELALREAARMGLRRGRSSRMSAAEPTHAVADLGTGSGAIAIALESELPDALVWATDASADALAVATANIAGAGATRVRTARGDWFDALPDELRGRLALVVSNPPYVTEDELVSLPAVVRDYEPARALVSGPTGMEAIDVIVRDARDWLRPDGALVVEIAEMRADGVRAAAEAAGFASVEVADDLTGRPRALIARMKP